MGRSGQPAGARLRAGTAGAPPASSSRSWSPRPADRGRLGRSQRAGPYPCLAQTYRQRVTSDCKIVVRIVVRSARRADDPEVAVAEPGPVPGADAAHPRNILEGELESGPPFLRAAVLSERQPASQQHACISHVWVVSATQKPLRRPRARPRTQSRQVTVRSEP